MGESDEEGTELTAEYAYQAALEEILGDGEISREEEAILKSLRDFLEIAPDVYQRIFETTRRRIQAMERPPLQREFSPEPFLFKILRKAIQDRTITAQEKEIIKKICQALTIDRETVEKTFKRAKESIAEENSGLAEDERPEKISATTKADVSLGAGENSASQIPQAVQGKAVSGKPSPTPAAASPGEVYKENFSKSPARDDVMPKKQQGGTISSGAAKSKTGSPPPSVTSTGKSFHQPASPSPFSIKPPSGPVSGSKKLGRKDLVAELGEPQLTTIIEQYVKNSLDPEPKTKVQLLQTLMSTGIKSEIAVAAMDYAENSDEGKSIALGTSWETLWYGLAGLIVGILLNVFTVVATGYIVKVLLLIPIFGFLAAVNSAQKIFLVNFPFFKGAAGQVLLFLCFIFLIAGLGYYILR